MLGRDTMTKVISKRKNVIGGQLTVPKAITAGRKTVTVLKQWLRAYILIHRQRRGRR